MKAKRTMNHPPPVIVIPGITGTTLCDAYTLPPEAIWTTWTKNHGRSALHPDDPRYEAAEPARVVPDHLFEVVYSELIEELRHNLRLREDRPVPVFPFTYDWRRPLEETEVQLHDFICEVIDRTKLLKHYNSSTFIQDPKVSLVGHSMGGLIIAGYLDRYGTNAAVAKVVTLATPFRGSFEAIIKLATGTATLGPTAPSSREREAARLTPSLYYLLPRFDGGLEVDFNSPSSIFDLGLWPRNVLATIEESIRLRGLHPSQRADQARTLFQKLLTAAKTHRDRIEAFSLGQSGLEQADWLCIVGVDCETRVRMRIRRRAKSPAFLLDSDGRENCWSDADEARRRLTGDGTVPFDGAVPAFLRKRNLVCVTPSDFGYWEALDRTAAAFAGFHGILPNLNMLHRLIVRHLAGRPDSYGNTWGRRPPGVSRRDWTPPVHRLRDKSSQ